jgi:uncharacterized protein YdhG (YjbR/CyaY superfamily)
MHAQAAQNRSMTGAEKTTSDFTAAERAAMRQRAKELKANESAAEALRSVVEKIDSLDEPDRTNARRIHEIVTEVAPSLKAKLYYGSPAYADADGKVVLFYQERAKFKVRYGNLAFFEAARLDDGTMWPTGFAVTELSRADEAVVAALVRKAAGEQ